jgi:hypothetical protein
MSRKKAQKAHKRIEGRNAFFSDCVPYVPFCG